MCHMYAIGMCNYHWQDWCGAGWHVSEGDWHTICKNLTGQNKKKHRDREVAHTSEETESAEHSTSEAKRPRLDGNGIDLNDI